MTRHRLPTLTAALVLATAAALGLASAEPPPTHPRLISFPDSNWQPPTAGAARLELAAGAEAYLITDSTLPLVDIVAVLRAGSFRDPAAAPGAAELTAALLRRGGTRALPPEQFDERADELGALLSSQASMLYGTASLRVTSDVLEPAIDLFLDMLQHPRFDPERVAAIKRNLAAGMSRRNLDPLRLLDREWGWLLYGSSHFSVRRLRRADLDALTPAILSDFHRRYWRPDNLLLAVAGDVDRPRLRALLDARLTAWASSSTTPPPDSWPPPPPPQPTARSNSRLYHLTADIPQSKVAIGHRAPRELPNVSERVQLEVMAEILGGRGAISRLSGRLRSAEGLVYRTSTRIDPGDLWPADYRIVFDTLAGNARRALAAAIEEIDRLRTAPPHPQELAVVQRELVARQRQEFDTAEEAVGYLVQDALVARPAEYRSRYRQLVEAVTPQQVLATAQRHLRPDALTVLVVGRWSELAGAIDAAGVSELERQFGQRVNHLPARDPLTLVPLLP